MKKRTHCRIMQLIVACVLAGVPCASADWPTYRADPARSGYTEEHLPEKLTLLWTHRSPHAPTPAWPTRNRQQFDRAYQPVIANGLLYYGSSADCKVYALDAHTGVTRWTFFTDSPVRFAPTVWQDRLFVASDDGHLYCLAAADGRLLWKLRGGPTTDQLLGNDRMISRWPMRGGPVVVDNVLYCGAGIWPTEGVFIYALDPASGRVLWCNDSSGAIEMDQPHPTARAQSGIASQGYLAVNNGLLLVPTGRAVPAVFDRTNGTLRYFHLQRNQSAGGCDVVAIDNHFFNTGNMFVSADGTRLTLSQQNRVGLQIAAHPDFVISAKSRKLVGFSRQKLLIDRTSTDRKGNEKRVTVLAPPVWSVKLPEGAMAPMTTRKGTEQPSINLMGSTAWSRPSLFGVPSALIVAGDRIIAAGQREVVQVDVHSHQIVWQAQVNGSAFGLAVTDGRLYVSTDRGIIHCFGAGVATVKEMSDIHARSIPADDHSVYATAAEEIIRRTGVTKGYCLDLASGECQLALALAKHTELQIYCIEKDPTKVITARRMLDEAGLYGSRVTVHQADPAHAPYPDYFADLVVSGRSITEGMRAVPAQAAQRMQRPFGGMACLGKPAAMQQTTRGPLKGAGNWTHQNTDVANTRCSSDSAVHGPLKMLWFRDTDFVMPNRHSRGPAPLVYQGRMIAEGIHGLRATSVYNGHTLWEYPIEGILLPYHAETQLGAAWCGSNICISDNRLYVHDRKTCLSLDMKTGRKLAELMPPLRPDGKTGVWGFIACVDGTVFGTLVDEAHLIKSWSTKWDTSQLFTESILLFAMDAQTGELKWRFTPEHSIRPSAIAIDNSRVYLIDRPPAPMEELSFNEDTARAEAKRRAAAKGRSVEDVFLQLTEHETGRLLALDAHTGKLLWENDEKEIFGTMLALSNEHKVLVMGYQARHKPHDWNVSERADRMAGFCPSDGTQRWDVTCDYVSPPIINDRTIYAQPGAWDILTGERLPFEFSRSYGCGTVVGSRRMLVFRSATLGYVDLAGAQRTENYGGIRPGCWINAIPAGGLILMADAASWCTCSYLNQATCALQPVE
jgi:outer membrane protein assembly factor BamB